MLAVIPCLACSLPAIALLTYLLKCFSPLPQEVAQLKRSRRAVVGLPLLVDQQCALRVDGLARNAQCLPIKCASSRLSERPLQTLLGSNGGAASSDQ